jgi:hypothetical protein
VRVAIDSTFPLADAARAHVHAAKGHLQGKIVLTVGCGQGTFHRHFNDRFFR